MLIQKVEIGTQAEADLFGFVPIVMAPFMWHIASNAKVSLQMTNVEMRAFQ